MPTENVEIVVKFIEQGSPNIERASLVLGKLTETANSGATATTGLGRAVEQTGRLLETNSTKVRAFGDAHAKAVTDVQAASAAIRGMEGSLSIRAVEQFTTKVLGLGQAFQSIFPLIGAAAAIEVLGRGVEKLGEMYNAWSPIVQAEEKALDVAKKLSSEYDKLERSEQKLLYSRVERQARESAIARGSSPEVASALGRSALLGFKASELEGDDKYSLQRKADDLTQKLQAVEGGIARSTSLRDKFKYTPGVGTLVKGAFDQAITGGEAERNSLMNQLEQVQREQGVALKQAEEYNLEAADIKKDAAKKDADKAKQLAAQQEARRLQRDSIFGQYERKNENPLGQFTNQLGLQAEKLGKLGYGAGEIGNLYYTALPQQTYLEGQEFSRIAGGKTVASIQSQLPRFDRGTFIADSTGDPKAQAGQDKAFSDGLAQSFQRQGEIRKEIDRDTQNAYVRILELAGSEYDAAAKTRDIRLEMAKDQAEQNRINLDYTVKIAELDQQRLDKYRQLGASLYDQGPKAFFQGGLNNLGRQLFANAAAPVLKSAGESLGSIGGASGISAELLKGTIFDPNNAAPMQRNTVSLDTLRKSVDRLTATMGGGGIAGLGGVGDYLPGGFSGLSDAISIFGSDTNGITGSKGSGSIIDKLFHTQKGTAVTSTIGGLVSGAARGIGEGNPLGAIFTPSGRSVQLPNGNATTYSTAERVGAGAGTAGVLYAGYQGVSSGIKEGGARGTFGAISSATATAAALDPEPVSKAALEIAAVTTGLIRSLMGDPKVNFDKEQTNLLNSRKYTDPTAMSYDFDVATGGTGVGYDWRGRSRVIVQRNITLNVNALDSGSIVDKQDDIATAVAFAIDKGHPVQTSVQKAIFGATS
jgi:hypothetical protein